MKIYVGNLPHAVSEEELQKLFEQYGPVLSVKIIKDKFTGSPRGFGFVEMGSDNEANQAISELNSKEFEGRTLRVNEARPMEARSPKGRFGSDSRSSRDNNRW